jgi:hypothetical protein
MAIEEKRMAQLVDNAAGWAANDIVPLRGEYAVEDAGVDSRIKGCGERGGTGEA